ncbi:MAG TPA: hypothetical protein VFR43_05295 [Gaiellaceae bacterium]|nr:hypothetical protein [Gaiellaceae bacterium]
MGAIARIVGLAALAAALAAPAAAVTPVESETLARGSGSGHFAVAFVHADDRGGRPLRLLVRSAPRQWVTAAWTISCHRGFRLVTASGTASGTTPLAATLPRPLARSAGCAVVAGAQLEGAGRVAVAVSG